MYLEIEDRRNIRCSVKYLNEYCCDFSLNNHELQIVQVTDTEEMEKKQQKADIIENLKIDEDNVLSGEEKVKLKNLLRRHQDVFPV